MRHGERGLIGVNLADGTPDWISGAIGVRSLVEATVVVSPDQQVLAVHDRAGVQLVAAATGVLLSQPYAPPLAARPKAKGASADTGITRVAFGADGSLLAAVDGRLLGREARLTAATVQDRLRDLERSTGLRREDGMRPVNTLPGAAGLAEPGNP